MTYREVDVLGTAASVARAARAPDGEHVTILGVEDLHVGLPLGITGLMRT